MTILVDSSAKATVQIRRILVLKRKHCSVPICWSIKDVTVTLGTSLNSIHLYFRQRFTGGLQGILFFYSVTGQRGPGVPFSWLLSPVCRKMAKLLQRWFDQAQGHSLHKQNTNNNKGGGVILLVRFKITTPLFQHVDFTVL
jgi:hypothetical protein